MIRKSHFFGIFEGKKGRHNLFLTKSLTNSKNKVYGEDLIRDGKDIYRTWDPSRSKLGAALHKGVSQISIKPGSFVLYLGAASGTTVSHISDIVGHQGFVFALDFAPRVLRELYFLCEERKNMTPLFEDANQPMNYADKICEVDVVFQDIAQRNQVDIFIKNCKLFLKNGGFGLLALKARSVDVTKKPVEIFNMARKQLEKEMIIVDKRKLDPFEKDHILFVVKKK